MLPSSALPDLVEHDLFRIGSSANTPGPRPGPDYAPKGAVDTDRGRNVKQGPIPGPAPDWGCRPASKPAGGLVGVHVRTGSRPAGAVHQVSGTILLVGLCRREPQHGQIVR